MTLKEREPRAILRTESGAFFIDRAGNLLGAATLDAADLPILTLTSADLSAVRAEARPPVRPPVGAGRGAAPAAAKAKGAAAELKTAPIGAPRADTAPRGAANAEQAGAPAPALDPAKSAAASMPSAAELRRAVRVAQWLERGDGGVELSELALKPGDPHPELVAFSSDGKLAIRLGWGEWREKLSAVRLVLDSAAKALAADAARNGRGVLAGAPSARMLAGTIDVHDPAAVVVRWARPGGAA